MRASKLIAVVSALLLLSSVSSIEAKTRRTSRTRAVQVKSSAKISAAKSSTSKGKKTVVAKGKGRRGKTRQVARRSGPPRQAAPTPERYMQIQQALADRGFYKGTVDGVWTAECTAALKDFQRSQNLSPDGKLGALSLIGLGLGPKRQALGDYAAKPASEPPIQP